MIWRRRGGKIRRSTPKIVGDSGPEVLCLPADAKVLPITATTQRLRPRRKRWWWWR